MQIRRKSVYREAAPVKNRTGFPFLCNVKMIGEEIIKLARSEEKTAKQKKKIDYRGEKSMYLHDSSVTKFLWAH